MKTYKSWELLFVYVYWILSAIWGNSFIQLSYGGINTFYIFVSVFLFHLIALKIGLINVKKDNFIIFEKKWRKWLASYSLIQIIYIILSYGNVFIKTFHLNIQFDVSYVQRQGYLIFMFPVIIILVYKMAGFNDYERMLCNRNVHILVWVILVFAREFYKYDTISMRSLAFAVASLILLQKINLLSCFVFIYTCLRLISLQLYISSVCALGIAFLCLCFPKIVQGFFKKGSWIRILLLVIGVLILLIPVYERFIILLHNDTNAEWRWQYWINEFNSIRKTYFLGVGYGSAYASNGIFNEINNYSMLLDKGIFVVTQHNSLMNIFYRLGILGLFIGIGYWIVVPLRWFSNIYQRCDMHKKRVLRYILANYAYNLMIIITNPGLESPRFAYGFVIVYSILIGFLLKYDRCVSGCANIVRRR